MAKLDRVAIDKARELQNLLPLTDDEFASLSGNGSSEEEKKAQLAEAKKKETELADKPKEEELKKLSKEKKEKTATPETIELSDEQLLKILSEKTGRNISSLDDLKPTVQEVDKEKLIEERETEKLSWALKNKKFKQKEYESYIADSSNKKDVVFRQYLAEAIKEDPELKEEDVEAEFNDRFGLNGKPESREYKRGQKELNLIADNILKQAYSPIYSLESEYSSYEQQLKNKKEAEAKVKQGEQAYLKTLENVFTGLKKISAKISDEEQYEVDTLDESLTAVKTMMSDKKWMEQQILNGYTPEDLQEIAFTRLLRDTFPFLANEISKQRLLKHSAGLKGIPKLNISEQKEEYNLNEAQKKFVEMVKEATPQVIAAN